jgi:pSer/pThr/pTyr-binding forkhead associated (FHA) protein
MVDPRLNSIHLPDLRRAEYRQAREGLLQSRGYQTICAVAEMPRESHSQTYVDSPASPPALATYWLLDKHRTYPLKIGVNTVGRSADNDVVVEDGCVSRRHCAILVHVSSGCELHDTASKNGTFVNGVRLTGPTRLRPGDEIRMCDQQYIFQARPDAPLDPPGNEATFSH